MLFFCALDNSCVCFPKQLLRDPSVALSLDYILFLGDGITFVYDLLCKLWICREGGITLCNGRVRENLLLKSVLTVQGHWIIKNLFNTFLSDAFSKMDKIARIAGEAMLEICHSTKIIPIRISYPSLAQCIITQIIDTFEHKATHHKTDGHQGFSFVGIARGKDLFKIWPVYLIRQKNKLVGSIYKICELWTKQISLFLIGQFFYHFCERFLHK